ncbi:DUF222 domain-containing protein [Microbacterium sp. NPDC055683]
MEPSPSFTSLADGLRVAVAGLDVAGAAAGELARLAETLGEVRRLADAALVPVAAEISRQSRRELGKDSFARKQGFTGAVALLSAVTGMASAEASRLIRVGEATAPRANLIGETLPSTHPHVADAVRDGRLSAASAGLVVAMLDRVAVRAGDAACLSMEEILVARIPGLTGDEVRRLLLDVEEHLDPDGAEPREEGRRDARMLSFRTGRDGMVTVTGRLDPETAAPVVAAIDRIVTRNMRRNEHEPDEAMRDRRTPGQMRADILADLARHTLGCDRVPTRPIATMVVRMGLDDLTAALDTHDSTTDRAGQAGVAFRTPRGGAGARSDGGAGAVVRVDGIEQPLTAGAIRRMAADAEIIPVVLGGNSEILDLGRARRLFTPAQKLAIAERDQGCAFCGAPPSHTVVHHIRWWSRGGGTDLDNAILLCTACHHRVHGDGWDIHLEGTGRDAIPWFTPPAWLDHTRTPRRGGPTRYHLAA